MSKKIENTKCIHNNIIKSEEKNISYKYCSNCGIVIIKSKNKIKNILNEKYFNNNINKKQKIKINIIKKNKIKKIKYLKKKKKKL